MTKRLFTKIYSFHFHLQNFLRRKQVVLNSILLFTLAFYLTSLPITFAKQPVTNIPNVQFAANPEKLIEKGEQLYKSGNFSQAVIVLQAAVRTYELQKDNIHQAAAFSNLALVYQQLGLLQEAENAINTSLNLLGWDVKGQKLKVNHQNSEPLEILAQTFDIQAGLQLSVGQSEVSLTTSQRAQKLWQQLGNGDRVTYSRINQAQALRVSGFYRRALDTLQAVNKQLQTQLDSPMKVAGLRIARECIATSR